jgi:hypothetical protein
MLERPLDVLRLSLESPEVASSLQEINSSTGIAVPILRRLAQRRFPTADIAEISRYTSTVASADGKAPNAARARVMEAVIRRMLGELGITAGISADEAGAAVVDLLVSLVASLSLGAAEVNRLIVEAENELDQR